ncbi:MAG: hypothetical protein LWW97_02345 [Deltaproteobacteria bacterium]|nr:hypothetical protein [Deltaproteobacteria bacterium]
MKRKKLLLWSLLMVISLLLWGEGIGNAAVTGRCDNCHTMHNSQDGSDLYASGPYDHLLVGGCVGCHSSSTEEQTYNLGTSTVPVVNYTGGEPSTYLAGGNFWWVATAGGNDDTKGHNVMEISAQDTNISATEEAPGNTYCTGAGGCHQTLAVKQTVQSTLGSGCQGCHLNVQHHTYDGSGTKYVGTAPWYRFLSGHSGGAAANYGVEGIEDDDWQKTVSAADHNEYKGLTGENSGTIMAGDGTMTAFCSGCHGNFHSEQDTGTPGQWTRHPSDFTIPNSGEYASVADYDPLSPVARTDSAMTGFGDTPSATVTAGSDMVMCLSCHRPHGSPYADLLRWDYSSMVAGSGTGMNTGCFYCHSNKDQDED